MNIVIGKERNEALMKKLGQDTQVYAPEQLPSLTAFLLDDPKIRHLIFLPDAQTGWSMGHILAAAQLLEHKGCIIFLFPQNQDLPRLIRRAQTLEDLDTLLKPGSTDTSSSGGRPAGEPEPAPKPPEPIRPMQIPAGAVLILSVAGSQQRIGCTTQAVGLWHYCKALGFTPAVVADTASVSRIAGLMKCRSIPDGYMVGQIPFVTSTAQAYDCYIQDMGVGWNGDPAAACKGSDAVVLVCGTKSWELQDTCYALDRLAAVAPGISILASFATEADVGSLQGVFGDHPAGAAPWMPSFWEASGAALELYDRLLRPVLMELLRSGRVQDLEPEISMEEIEITEEIGGNTNV